jgi:predicted phage terminase large subunit-like protein
MIHDQQLVRAILREDLYCFIQAAFPTVSPGASFAPNWHIEAIAYALTRVLNGEIKRLIITVPPRSLKSICTSVAFPAFVLGHDPTRRIICVSYAEGLARKHANDCRAIMRSALYNRLFPETRISLAKDTELEFATTHGGNRLSTSVGGTLTGRGGNLIIIDDPLKPQDAHSEAARESTKQWYSNTLLSRLDDKINDAIIVVMQRLHLDDLVGHLLEQEGWIHLNLPAIAEAEHQIPLGQGRFHLRRPGDLLHPEREPRAVLDEFKRSMGSLDFAAQYQQEPVAEGGNLIKWDWFKFYQEPPARQSGDRIIVSWDTALSSKELSSYSACVVLQVKGETAYVLEVFRGRLEYPDLKRKVIAVYRQWRNACSRFELVIENKGSGMSLIQDLKREGINAIAVDPEGDKAMRMNAQTARIEAGSVLLPRQAAWLDDFRAEILPFPAGRYSDQVDAFSQALHRAFTAPRGECFVGIIGVGGVIDWSASERLGGGRVSAFDASHNGCIPGRGL